MPKPNATPPSKAMTNDLKSKTALWVDQGLFFGFAQRCARDFGRTLYWTPFASAFPKSNYVLPGDGFDDVEHVLWLWDAVKEADIIIFPDVNFGDLQEHLVACGHRVWGSRRGEVLELNRMKSKKIMSDHGVQPSPAVKIRGMANLRAYLKEHENVHLKTSLFRGDFESWRSINYRLSEPKLDEMEHKLGEKKKIYEFVVESHIDSLTEWGIDAFTIDGQWPDKTFIAREAKDLGAIGKVCNWSELPDFLRAPNEQLSPWFKAQQYRGFFSTELLITDSKETFFIDACCRLPSPPNEVMQEIFSNWAEIIWRGADSELVSPEPLHQYGVVAMVHSAWADKEWQAVDIPDDVRQWVKFRNHTRIDGRDYTVPMDVGLPEIAGVVGVGDTLDDAIAHLEHNAEQIQGFFVDVKLDAIPDIVDELETVRQLGIVI